jgi:hypothetical protein
VNLVSRQAAHQWRFLQLTLVIVGWMLASSHVETRWLGHVAMQVLLLDLMFVALWANPQWRLARYVIGALWLLSFSASVLSVLGITERWQLLDWTLNIALTTPVIIACAAGVLSFAFRAERPTLDGIFAMVVVYLLIGTLFAEFYFLAILWDHESLRLLKPFAEIPLKELRGDLQYFSLVTLSTVGYGDIVPVSSTVRMLATIEAVTGQFYVAVVVATFVTLWVGAEARMKHEAARPASRDGKD